MPKRVGVELERINNKKIHYFLEYLMVFLHTILQDARFNHKDEVFLVSLCNFQLSLFNMSDCGVCLVLTPCQDRNFCIINKYVKTW
jgi:hypothetical protein